MDIPEDYFLTPTFDENNPVNSISGLNFVSSFKTAAKDKYEYLSRIPIPTKCKKMLLGSIRKVYNHMSEECGVLRFLEAYGKVPIEALVDFFKRPVIRPYGSIGRSKDPQRTVARFRDIAWPMFIRGYDYFNIAGLLCRSVPPGRGQELTRKIMEECKEKGVIKLYRLVSRAEDDLVPYLGELVKNNVEVEINNADPRILEMETRNELKLLSPIPKEHPTILGGFRRILLRDYIEPLKKYCMSLGTWKDPIYCIRVEEDLRLNTDPHYLGNLITRFNNLCGFLRQFQDRGIDLETEERLRIYEYEHSASFRGTVVYDQNGELSDGIFVTMIEGGPGRLSVLRPLRDSQNRDRSIDESLRTDVEKTIGTLKKERVLYESNSHIIESLYECRESIREVAETINGKAANREKEMRWHLELKDKLLNLDLSKKTVAPLDLSPLKRSLYALYFRLPSEEEIGEMHQL